MQNLICCILSVETFVVFMFMNSVSIDLCKLVECVSVRVYLHNLFT